MTSTPDLSPLIGAQMTRLCLDYAVTLLLAAYDAAGEQWLDATMKIEAPFTVSAHDSRTWVEPDTGQNLAALLGLLHSTVQTATVTHDQTLTLVFDTSVTVTVPRDTQYESWELLGEGVEGWLMDAAPARPRIRRRK